MGLKSNSSTSDFERQAAYSRIVPGGITISKTTNQAWAITPGVYYIVENGVSTRHTFAGATNIPIPALLSTVSAVYIYLNNSGTYEFSADAPKLTSYDGSRLSIGVVTSQDDGANLNNVISIKIDNSPAARAFLAVNNGIINTNGIGISLKTGAIEWALPSDMMVAVGRNSANDDFNRDVVNIAAQATINAFVMNRSGDILGAETIHTYNRLDDGSGDSLANLPTINGNDAGAHRIFLSASGTVVHLLPQFSYGSINLAIERSSQEQWIKPPILNGFVQINTIIARADTTAGNHGQISRTVLLGAGGALPPGAVPDGGSLLLYATKTVNSATDAPGSGQFGTVIYGTATINESDLYDTVTGQFAVPETRSYRVSASGRLSLATLGRHALSLYNVTDNIHIVPAEIQVNDVPPSATSAPNPTIAFSRPFNLETGKVYEINHVDVSGTGTEILAGESSSLQVERA